MTEKYTQEEIRDMLASIDASRLTYNDWFRVLASIKAAGGDESTAEEWCKRDNRFHANDVRKRWSGITDAGGASAGTLVWFARQGGYQGRGVATSPAYHPIRRKSTPKKEPEVTRPQTVEDLPSVAESLKDFEAFLLEGLDHTNQRKAFLEALFGPDEYVNIVHQGYEDKNKPGHYIPSPNKVSRKRADWCHGKLMQFEEYDKSAGMWVRINPIVAEPQGSLKADGTRGNGISDDDIAAFRYTLVESDDMPEADQIEAYKRLHLPIVATVLSGGKSVHAVVRVDAKNREEYDERVKTVHEWCQKYGITIDPANKNPSRLMRLPGVTRGKREQKLLGLQYGPETWEDFEYFMEGQKDNIPALTSINEINGDNLPELPPEIVTETLRLRDIMMLAGGSKSGKTFLLIELALAVASGTTWLERPCKSGGVLYCNMEVPDAVFAHRVQNVREKLGIPLDATGNNLSILNLRGHSMDLEGIKKTILYYARKHSFSLIVLDPLYKILGNRDENSAGDVGNLFDEFDSIAEATGAAVVFCHHHSKGGQAGKASMDRSSGSGVFARAPDVILDMLELEVPADVLAALDFDSVPSGLEFDWTFRGYAPRKPEHGFFSYPIHTMDHDGLLANARTAREAKAADARRRNAHRVVHWQNVCDTCYETILAASPAGYVPLDDLVEAVMEAAGSTSDEFVKKRIKGSGYKITRGKPSKGIPTTVAPVDDEVDNELDNQMDAPPDSEMEYVYEENQTELF